MLDSTMSYILHQEAEYKNKWITGVEGVSFQGHSLDSVKQSLEFPVLWLHCWGWSEGTEAVSEGRSQAQCLL